MGKLIDRLDLECRSGSKDAVYQLQLEEVEGGFVVNYQNGRRGGTLASGTKTKCPVSLEAARKAFDKVAKDKLTAQPPYVRMGGSGESFQAVSAEMAEQSTGLVPQLLNDVPEGQLEPVLVSDEYVGQVKIDGQRRMVRASRNGVVGSNRRGLQVPLPKCIEHSVAGVECELDGEILGSRLFVFDILSMGERDLRSLGFRQRNKVLESMVGLFGEAVTVLPLAEGEAQKRMLIERTKELGQEGVTFKHVDAPYVPGRPNSGGSQLRLKHWKDATVYVLGENVDRRSVRMGVLTETGLLIEVGSVTIPANHDIPAKGLVIDVKYLYAFEGGDLFQPTFKGVRDDLTMADAVASRLVFKSEHVDVAIEDESDTKVGAPQHQDSLF